MFVCVVCYDGCMFVYLTRTEFYMFFFEILPVIVGALVTWAIYTQGQLLL